jgi:hypothetical protein
VTSTTKNIHAMYISFNAKFEKRHHSCTLATITHLETHQTFCEDFRNQSTKLDNEYLNESRQEAEDEERIIPGCKNVELESS